MTIVIRGVTFEGTSGSQLFDQTIETSIEMAKFVAKGEEYQNLLCFTPTSVIGPDMKFSSYDPGNGLYESAEGQKAQELKRRFENPKGLYQKEYKGAITVSGVFYDWARHTNSVKGAPNEVQAKILEIGNDMEFIMANGEKTKAQIMLRVITEGEDDSNPSGPGSATPNGLPLFSTMHPVAIDGTVQSNLITLNGDTDADRVKAAEDAVNALRKMRIANGDYVYTRTGEVEPYILYVSVGQKFAWERALNALKIWSGTGQNANQVNMFRVGMFDIVIKELPMLNTYDVDGNLIGNENDSYLFNPVFLKEAKALRNYSIRPLRVETIHHKDPEYYKAIGTMMYGADHYGAELGIVKIKANF